MLVFFVILLLLPASFAFCVEETLCLINSVRQCHKLPALGLREELSKAAMDQAKYMAEIGKISHTGRGGCNVGQRADKAGYIWNKIGENVGFGYNTDVMAMHMFMCSEGHRKNIVGAQYVMAGLAFVKDPKGVDYFAQVFGQKNGEKVENVPKCDKYAKSIQELKRLLAQPCPAKH